MQRSGILLRWRYGRFSTLAETFPQAEMLPTGTYGAGMQGFLS